MDKILDYNAPGDLAGFSRDLGSFALTYNRDLQATPDGDANSPETAADEALKQKVRNGEFEQTPPAENANDDEPEDSRKFFSDFGSDLQFPFLTEPSVLMGMLVGDSSLDLFRAEVQFEVSFEVSQDFPVFAGMASVGLGVGIGAGADLGVGYDVFGVAQMTHLADFSSVPALNESLDRNRGLLLDGFYVDDHNPQRIEDGTQRQQDSRRRCRPGGRLVLGEPDRFGRVGPRRRGSGSPNRAGSRSERHFAVGSERPARHVADLPVAGSRRPRVPGAIVPMELRW